MLISRWSGCAMLMLLGLALFGCGRVGADQVPGRYEASYPFGKETLILMTDGHFAQEIAIDGEDAVKVTGNWRFDAAVSRVRLDGAMVVVDSVGAKRQSWKTPGVVSSDVERHPSGILIGSARPFPYIKK